ncbi:pentatricopeptide repeat-containing protein [Iris pallida]|uniref:Pentatricopeptide repeat-containing protein n=1 Tax=Iris pallida TaxID=29817 RepID=A0AAX6DFI0_IRIPA|nr:pentatricopeptide repeat-containing protein [Iris pallida]
MLKKQQALLHRQDILAGGILYSKCGRFLSASHRTSAVSWNCSISGLVRRGHPSDALHLFVTMRRQGTPPPTEFTLSTVLSACAAARALPEASQVHALAVKTSMGSDVFVGTALLDAYSKCSRIADARRVFDGMPDRSPVTWSSMVSGLAQNHLYEDALMFFRSSQRMGVGLTQFTLSAVLSACASLAATTQGTQLHALLVRTGLDSDIYVATSLIDVYSRCGRMEEAYRVFSCTDGKNIALWNAVIAGFSRHARLLEATMLFEKMQQFGELPNEVTYVSLLSACGHAGSVEKGRGYFDLMLRDGNVRANVLHYSCMVDVLGRAGLVSEARDLIETMPYEATPSMWGSLLSSCRIHGDHEVAKVAADHLFEMEPNNAGNHVLLSNVYASNKKWGEVAMTRKLLKDSSAKKEMGKSWIEVKNKVYVFVVGEGNHPMIGEIYAKLEELGCEMKKLDFKPETEYDLHDVEEEQKEELLKHHSEKLALAFGLISLPPCLPVRINKNLRICGDCHSFMKFASKIRTREIIVRDTNRFHHFKDGLCSCGDFW